MLHQCCPVACTIQLLRAMRDAEKISSRLLRKRVLDICCSSLPSNIFPWAPSAEYNARCPYMSPVSWQHSATGPLYNLHTSPFIHKNKNLAQDQPEGRKSSVDAHGVSSCLGCSRILRHLISFLTSSQDFRSRKIMEKTMGQEIAATPQNKASQAKKNIHCLLMGVPTGPDVMNPLPTTCFSHHWSICDLTMCFPDYNIAYIYITYTNII